jgi:hypothetical protein
VRDDRGGVDAGARERPAPVLGVGDDRVGGAQGRVRRLVVLDGAVDDDPGAAVGGERIAVHRVQRGVVVQQEDVRAQLVEQRGQAQPPERVAGDVVAANGEGAAPLAGTAVVDGEQRGVERAAELAEQALGDPGVARWP